MLLRHCNASNKFSNTYIPTINALSLRLHTHTHTVELNPKLCGCKNQLLNHTAILGLSYRVHTDFYFSIKKFRLFWFYNIHISTCKHIYKYTCLQFVHYEPYNLQPFIPKQRFICIFLVCRKNSVNSNILISKKYSHHFLFWVHAYICVDWYVCMYTCKCAFISKRIHM